MGVRRTALMPAHHLEQPHIPPEPSTQAPHPPPPPGASGTHPPTHPPSHIPCWLHLGLITTTPAICSAVCGLINGPAIPTHVAHTCGLWAVSTGIYGAQVGDGDQERLVLPQLVTQAALIDAHATGIQVHVVLIKQVCPQYLNFLNLEQGRG